MTEKKDRKRVPLGTRNILTSKQKSGYRRRFVNDVGDRVEMFKQAGWKPVCKEPVGDDKAGKVTSMGSVVNPSVGGGQRAILMEIPEEFYLEDEKRKQAKIDKVENEIKRTKPGADGLDGKVTVTR